MADLKKVIPTTVVAALVPFLVIAGMSLDDVKLTDENEFANQAAYIEYRDEKLADHTVWDMNDFYKKSREMVAIYEYEIKKNDIQFTIEEVNAMKGTDIRQMMEAKIKSIK